MMDDPALPAWAREGAFPEKPDLSPYGCRDARGSLVSFDDLAGLESYLSAGKGKLAWVWIPERDRLIAPEEFAALAPSLKKRRRLFAQDDLSDGRRGALFFGAFLIWSLYATWKNGGFSTSGYSQNLVIAGFFFFFFAIRPLWQGWQGLKELKTTTAASIAAEVPEARFELWLNAQKSWVTVSLLGMISVVGIAQLLVGGGFQEAGLVKSLYAAGEHWRLFTATFMHGHVLHFLMNASALWFLGRRVEILARWPHLVMVFVVSMLGAGWATTAWLPTGSSVGVSGVICGLLGFLLVFETLHRPLVPLCARKRLLGILGSLIVIGMLGFQFIDNAAHLGGLIAGAAYALLVFPKSSSTGRPMILRQDRVMGLVAAIVIYLSGIAAIVMILAS